MSQHVKPAIERDCAFFFVCFFTKTVSQFRKKVETFQFKMETFNLYSHSTCMSSECGRKPEHLKKNHTGAEGKTCELHTEKTRVEHQVRVLRRQC